MGLVVATNRNRIVDNVAGNNGVGMDVSGDHNVLERNSIETNSDGIVISGNYNLLDSNLSEGNGRGIYFVSGAGHAYRSNMLPHNSSFAVLGPATDAGGNVL